MPSWPCLPNLLSCVTVTAFLVCSHTCLTHLVCAHLLNPLLHHAALPLPCPYPHGLALPRPTIHTDLSPSRPALSRPVRLLTPVAPCCLCPAHALMIQVCQSTQLLHYRGLRLHTLYTFSTPLHPAVLPLPSPCTLRPPVCGWTGASARPLSSAYPMHWTTALSCHCRHRHPSSGSNRVAQGKLASSCCPTSRSSVLEGGAAVAQWLGI